MRRFYYRLKMFFVTLAIGLLVVNIWTRLADYYSEIPVNLPHVESESLIIVRPMPWKGMPRGGGGGSGGASDGNYTDIGGGSGADGITCEDFIKSLGKLTEQSRRILAHTPCSEEARKNIQFNYRKEP
jgi:hypothetical protein